MRLQRWSYSDLRSADKGVARSRRNNGAEVRLDFDLHKAA
jgi:hypothetical protein